MNKLTQFWFGNLFYHVPSFYYTLIVHSTHFQVKFLVLVSAVPFKILWPGQKGISTRFHTCMQLKMFLT